MSIQKPKGTYDVCGDYGKKILYLEDLIKALMSKYNYDYIRTPLFESSDLYHRGVGETSDIVSKETYDFVDRGERKMTLRPEGTAGVVRSFIENKMYGEGSQPTKLWYFGPMYRYERPQAGRYREFYQFGVEAFGSSDALMDAEVISIIVNFFKLLGLKGVKVNINTLGDLESRMKYRQALLDYFKPHLSSLCDDCKNRYEKNPLRILDCKVDHELDIMKNAPKIYDYLNDVSLKHYEDVKKYLDALEIEYVENPSIVRGLDYYTHTVFEVEASVEGFGSQNVLGAGGRYDGLVETLDGPSTPGVGFAIGIERLITALEYEKIELPISNSVDVYVIPVTENEKEYSINLVNMLRMNGFSADMDYMSRAMKGNLKQADRLNAKVTIIVGEEEIADDVLSVKNNVDNTSEKIDACYIINYLDEVIEETE